MCENNVYTSDRDIYKRLCCTLSAASDVKTISGEFSKLHTNSARVDVAYRLLQRFSLFPECKKVHKSVQVALDCRNAGNNYYKIKKDDLALRKYTESIASAPKNSLELALAFANRSAVLYQLKLFRECLRDIDKALSCGYPQHLREKLLQRKVNAETAQPTQSSLSYHQDIPSLSYEPNQLIQCASNCIQLKFEDSSGRHIVATNDIKVGDIIAIEEPFTQILLKGKYLTHCYNCLRPFYNLIPCDNCVLVLFCNEDCKRSAWASFHKHECPILPTLLDLNVNDLTLLALKISILVDIKHYPTISESIYKSQNYDEIHNLITNTNLRPTSDLFERAVIAAVIYDLMEKNTSLLRDEDRKDCFKELQLLHMQTGPSNFHEISEVIKTANNYYELEEIGAGAYSFLSLLNHSCCPNVVRHCYGSSIVLRALRPIIKGEQLFDNYGYHHAIMSKQDRRDALGEQYFFECKCEACNENWPLYPELPVRDIDIPINEDHLRDLKNGSTEVSKCITMNLQDIAESLEGLRPCKELADVQEILKQCYAVCGNKRVTF